ncbi:glycoside hydrolase family protein [Arenibacter algicola]|uniref:Glycosyl hydrolase n=1 Tax=Arenibacter algicola TaxID=616991 RepID=A0A221UUH0_9FLAO|nr:glycosylase [Arenibacter algicola]ASO04995.1 glycosyl hydrolase [Arenibacter algicola]
MTARFLVLTSIMVFLLSCKDHQKTKENANTEQLTVVSPKDSVPFPFELTHFQTPAENPVFTGTGMDTWDHKIRERGYIIKEEGTYHMWYTGLNDEKEPLALGYATSLDGIAWKRYNNNPVFNDSWTEDMMVIKEDGTYHMFAEGINDIAHRLTSTDRIHWTDHGSLDIRNADGSPLSEGPYGTPTVWRENNIWYLFYERNDLGIWLATSKDLKVWTNAQDEPVITMGPEAYDKYGVAVNQIIKYKGWYYAYYHGTPFEDWSLWSTNVAASKDLLLWKKYPQNPIMEENRSSGILVPDGDLFRLYTMHDKVEVHFPKSPEKN